MNTKNPLYYINIEKNILNRFDWFFVNKKHNSIKFIFHDTVSVNKIKIQVYISKIKTQGNLILFIF